MDWFRCDWIKDLQSKKNIKRFYESMFHPNATGEGILTRLWGDPAVAHGRNLCRLWGPPLLLWMDGVRPLQNLKLFISLLYRAKSSSVITSVKPRLLLFSIAKSNGEVYTKTKTKLLEAVQLAYRPYSFAYELTDAVKTLQMGGFNAKCFSDSG